MIESFTVKEEDGLTPFFILDVLEASSDIMFWKGILSEEMSVIHRQHRNLVAMLATKAEFLSNVSRICDRIGHYFEP